MDRNRTILHVDDDPAVLRLVSSQLNKEGYEVICRDDSREASATLLGTGARVVLLDIDMPHIDGLTLLNELKKQDGGVQVIMLTGLVSMSTVLQSMRWGAEACVFKPLTDFNPLLAALRSAFENIDRWWQTLDDLQDRRTNELEVFVKVAE